MCEFCTHPKIIQHLFFDYHFAKFLWRAVQVTSVEHLSSSCTNGGVGIKLKKLALIGAYVLCWTLWINRNDIVFDKSLIKMYM
jgi:hypothetical protein